MGVGAQQAKEKGKGKAKKGKNKAKKGKGKAKKGKGKAKKGNGKGSAGRERHGLGVGSVVDVRRESGAGRTMSAPLSPAVSNTVVTARLGRRASIVAAAPASPRP